MTSKIQKSVRIAILFGTTSLSGLMATPAAAQCVTVPGVLTTCTPPTATTPVPPVLGAVVPVVVNLPPLFNTTSPITVTTTDAIVVDPVTTAVLSATGVSPLILTSGTDVTAQVSALASTGANAPGALITAGDDVLLTVDNTVTTAGTNSDGVIVNAGDDATLDLGAVSTNGLQSDGILVNIVGDALVTADSVATLQAASDGINVRAGTIDVNVGGVTTAGANAQGVELLALSGPATFDAVSIATLGPDSTAAVIDAAGDIDVEAEVLRTQGDRALGLDLNTNLGACVLVASGGDCDVDAVVGEITTGNLGLGTGANAIGALITAAGDIDLDVGVLTTNGADAVGVQLQSNPTVCALLLATGGCETEFSADQLITNGPGGIGALIRAAGPTTLDIGLLETRGPNAPGLNLAVDPTACVQLGVANCGTDLEAETIRTLGINSAGVLIVSPANLDLDLGTVDTLGANAPAVSIAGNPELCLVLGAGTCNVTTTLVTADNLLTDGPGSAGLLITSPTQVVADLGRVETLGLNAPAVSIAGDPRVCVLLGRGACNATLAADNIVTQGAGSAGVLVNSPATVVADLDNVATDGPNSAGVTLITDTTLCLLLGAGACGVVVGDGSGGTPGGTPGAPGTPTGPGGAAGGTPGTPGGTNVDTDGNNSPGVVVVTPGPVDVDAGTVTTDGNDSPGIDVDGGEAPIDVDFDVIDTDGNNSPGVDIGGFGPINVGGGSVQTDGANSPGIVITGDNDPVRVDVNGPIGTLGPNSDGIDVGTTTGPITILAGPVTTAGAGSIGIDANAAGCADVNVTARDDINSANIGIDASSACNVTVITQVGAPVAGTNTGINVVADSDGNGTGVATITIGDRLSSGPAGLALNADSGAATVTILGTGRLDGRFDLTNANDTLTNNGIINAVGDSSFGGGANDRLFNNNQINVTGGTVFFTGLETTTNSGTINLQDGLPNDTLVLSGGNFVGTGGSTLRVDVGAGTGISDQLAITGTATGSTVVLVDGLNGGFVNSAIVANAGAAAGTSPTAFTFTPRSSGLVDYSLVFLPAGNDFAIFGTPNINAVQLGLLTEGAREVFYRGNDAVAAHLGSGLGWDTEGTPISRAFWFQGFGMVQNRDRTTNATPFGQARSYNLDSQQDFFGGQVGFDIGGGGGSVFGVTAGYIGSNLKFDATPLRLEYEAANIGAYGRLNLAGFTLSGLIKYEKYWIDGRNTMLGFNVESDGNGWGGFVEAGYRFGGTSFFVEPLASIEYANIDLDGFNVDLGAGSVRSIFAFDEAEGIRGKAGLRFGAILDSGPNRVTAYGKVQAIHEFEGDDELRLTNSGLGLDFDNDATDTYGRATAGVDIGMFGGVRGFIEGSIDFAGDVSGGGARGGLSIGF